MSIYIERLFYKNLSAASSQMDDYVVPAGKILSLNTIGGDASSTTATEVALIWDPAGANELVFATHGNSNIPVSSKDFTGNGTKVLRILLTNDQLSSDRIGGFWKGQLYDIP